MCSSIVPSRLAFFAYFSLPLRRLTLPGVRDNMAESESEGELCKSTVRFVTS